MRISDWSSDVCSSDLRRLYGTDADSAQRVRRRKVRADGWRRGDAEDHRRVRAESGGVTLRVKKPGSKLGERLRKIGDDVVGVFDPDRQAHHIRPCARANKGFVIQLAVPRRCRMDDARNSGWRERVGQY